MIPVSRFPFLSNQTLPKILAEGLKLMGTAEIPGPKSNEEIMAWARAVGVSNIYHDDDIAWCGLFIAYVVHLTDREPVKDPLWARNWARWGVAAPTPMLGDILVFKRGSGGHVGVYVAEDALTYYVLGGNQSNRVSITRIMKDRLLAARRPQYKNQPSSVKQYTINANGKISTNEA